MPYPSGATGCGCDGSSSSTSGATGTAGCEGFNVPCITVVNGSVTSITDRTLTIPSGDVCPSDLCQEGATEGQVIEWNGSIWAPATPSGGSGGGGGEVVTLIAGTAESWSMPVLVGVNPFYVGEEPRYITDTSPTSFRMTYNHVGGGAEGACEIGFEYSEDGTTWTVVVLTPINLSDLGLHTLTGSIPATSLLYIRPVYTNNFGDESFIANGWTITLFGSGGGGGGVDAATTTYTLATLKALTTHSNGDGVMVRFGTVAGDGVSGPRWYDSTSVATPDDNDVIQPTDVGGAGRWLRIF